MSAQRDARPRSRLSPKGEVDIRERLYEAAMKTYTASQINRLKVAAKELRRSDPTLKHTEALDEVARREGWSTWAALHLGATTPSFSDSLKFLIRPVSSGRRGMFCLELAIDDPKPRSAFDKGVFSFELPRLPADWELRMPDGTMHAQKMAVLESMRESPKGAFVDGRFQCIISVHGISNDILDCKVAERLLPISAQIRDAVNTASEAWLPNPGEDPCTRLFFSLPRANAIHTLKEQTFLSLEEAQNAILASDAVRVGISGPEGWWFHSRYAGWKKHYGWTDDSPTG